MFAELKHQYGEQYHLIQSELMSGLLAELCLPETFQPKINSLVKKLYRYLLYAVIENEFEKKSFQLPTRMTSLHPEQMNQGVRIDPSLKAVCVNLARAGTYPSHLCYEELHDVLKPENLRQDHIFAARATNASQQVTGTDFGSMKIGGGVKNNYVLFPDPMGATGTTLMTALDYYKGNIEGPAKKYISMHLIITPEYLSHLKRSHPDLVVYALRLDRGLSTKRALSSELGQYWDEEKGLNSKQYIVPGAGGLGEVLNNSFI